MIETLRDLLTLAKQETLTQAQRAEAIQHMRKLREKGFSNREIATLSQHRWSQSHIKRSTRGVKVGSTMERDHVLNLLVKLSQGGGTLEDVSKYLLDREKVGRGGFKELVELKEEMYEAKLTVPEATGIIKDVARSGHTVNQLTKLIEILEDLAQDQIFLKDVYEFYMLVNSYSGKENTITALKHWRTIDAQLTEQNRLTQSLQRLEKDIQIKDQELEKLGKISMISNALLYHGYTSGSALLLLYSVEKFGKREKILEAINKYESLQGIETMKKIAEQTLDKQFDESRMLEQKRQTLVNESVNAQLRRDQLDDNLKHTQKISSLWRLATENQVQIPPEDFLESLTILLDATTRYITTQGDGGAWEQLNEQIKATQTTIKLMKT